MSIKIKHGHTVEFYEGRTLLRDDSGEEVEIDRSKPIRIWWEDGRDHADIPCVGGKTTSEPVAGAILLACLLSMEILTDQGSFAVFKRAQ